MVCYLCRYLIIPKYFFMNQYLVDQRQVSATEERELTDNVFLVAPGVWRMKDLFVNVFIIQNREGTNWILVDTGLKSSAAKIKRMIADVLRENTGMRHLVNRYNHVVQPSGDPVVVRYRIDV